MRLRFLLCACGLGCGLWIGRAEAYFVGPMPSLDAMTAQADVVVKVRAGEGASAKDAWFGDRDRWGYEVRATQFRVVSSLKGDLKAGANVPFFHLDEAAEARRMPYSPQFYHFEPGRSYLIFASKTPTGLRQLWLHHTDVMDAGAFQLADDKPIVNAVASASEVAREVLWSEWSRMLSRADDEAVSYAIGHLNALSRRSSRPNQKPEFDEQEVLERIAPLFSSRSARIAQAVMGATGARHARRFQSRFIAVANAHPNIATRVVAIGYLSELKTPLVEASVQKWARFSPPPVQMAAVPLLGNFPTSETLALLQTLARSRDAKMRQASSVAMGRARAASLLPTLESLLGDASENVRRASAESLLQYPLALSSRILKKHRTDAGLGPNFIYALAKDDPQPYLGEIARVLRERTPSLANFNPDGRNALSLNWRLLFEWLESRPLGFRRSPQATPLFEALQVEQDWSSSEPVETYRLLRVSGLEERAQKFRREREKSARYDISMYFKHADQSIAPSVAQDITPGKAVLVP